MAGPSQIAHAILMIRPAAFGFNPETAESNAFQKPDASVTPEEIHNRAVEEFDNAVKILREHGVTVVVEEDTSSPKKSDAIFPNNWLSTHSGGTVITYPMFSASRRHEVRDEIIDALGQQFQIIQHWRMEGAADSGAFLEGTGSMVLDRINRIAYACRSARTNETLLSEFCQSMGYSPLLFSATDQNKKPIYHTNVMMSVMQRQAVVCLESIPDPAERESVVDAIESCGHTIITTTQAQLERFACNVLQIGRSGKEPVLVLSETAYGAFSESQLKQLKRESDIVPLSIGNIEHFGGGSVRCMLAEIFLPPI